MGAESDLAEGLSRTVDYFKKLDLRRFKKPTKHTAHANSEQVESMKKKDGAECMPKSHDVGMHKPIYSIENALRYSKVGSVYSFSRLLHTFL